MAECENPAFRLRFAVVLPPSISGPAAGLEEMVTDGFP
jgi:hypothetical protein